MADNSELIANLKQIKYAGAESVTIDGVTTRWDLEQIDKTIDELTRQDEASISAGMVRPTVQRITIGGCW